MAFVFLASAGTSEDCIQGAKCARPGVKAAEYTNLRKHRQWIANDTQNKTGKKPSHRKLQKNSTDTELAFCTHWSCLTVCGN